MWGFLRFTFITLIMFPSSIFCNVPAEPAPDDALSIQTPRNPLGPIYERSFTFQWRGTNPNFTLKLFDFTATLSRTFSNISDTSFTWDPVDIQSGTEVYLVLTDSLSNSTYSGNFMIQSHAGPGQNPLPSNEDPALTGGNSSSASVSPPTCLPTSSRPPATTATSSLSDAASPSVSEYTSLSGSSPSSLSTRAIVGISLGVLAIAAGAIASLLLCRGGRRQWLSQVHPRWSSRAIAVGGRNVSALSRWKSLPAVPFRQSGDSWGTQSSEPRSEKPVAWNPGLFARDMSSGSPCLCPLPPAHQELPGHPRSAEGCVNLTLLSLTSTDLPAGSRSDPLRSLSRSSVQRPQTPLSIVSSINEPEVH